MKSSNLPTTSAPSSQTKTSLPVLDQLRDRRELLHIAIASTCIAACGGGGMGDGSTDNDASVNDVPTSTDVPPGMDVPASGCMLPGFERVGPVASFPVGMFTFQARSQYFVGRDAMGLYALSSSCTHRGCDVLVNGAGFRCPCHQATYDANGEATGGPANGPLSHFALMVCEGDVYVNPMMTVGASTRTAV